jgi:hypothetical protein
MVFTDSVQHMSTPLSAADANILDSIVFSPASSPPSSGVSTLSSCSDFPFGCHTPEHGITPYAEIIDHTFPRSDPEDYQDGDYLSSKISHSYNPAHWRLFNTTQNFLSSNQTTSPKTKRKATSYFFNDVAILSY